MEQSGPLQAYLKERLGAKILDYHAQHGDETVAVDRQGLEATFRLLKEDVRLDLDFLTDLTAVDYLGRKEPRFEVVYHLYSIRQKHLLRIKVPVPEHDPVVDSVTPLWKGANWFEREVWDMFGIRFRGHPDLRRILLYEEFQGHPLRKDYPVNLRQPLIPERALQGTFVDERSDDKLRDLQRRFTGRS